MVRVPVYDDSVGIIITNSLPRNRNVSGNVALLINLRYLARCIGTFIAFQYFIPPIT
jgi:hypothetical protein